MLITQNLSSCNTVRDVGKEISYTSNLLPNIWYQKLLSSYKKSNVSAAAILSELFFRHHDNDGTEFYLNFSYWIQRFNFVFCSRHKLVKRYFGLCMLSKFFEFDYLEYGIQTER